MTNVGAAAIGYFCGILIGGWFAWAVTSVYYLRMHEQQKDKPKS